MNKSSSNQYSNSNSIFSEIDKKLDALPIPERVTVKKLRHLCDIDSIQRNEEEIQKFMDKHGVRILGTDASNPIFSFDELDLPNDGSEIFYSLCYQVPTIVQAVSFPNILNGRDMIGVAKTGSGKTITYLIPAILHCKKQVAPRGPFALILVPTRELAKQVYCELFRLQSYFQFNAACLYGGENNRREQIEECNRQPHIVVACLGRLIDFMVNNIIDISYVSYLVLDEADKMLEMGFEDKIGKIFKLVQPRKQVLMWSATWPREVRELAKDYLKNALHIVIGASELTINENIQQKFELVEDCDKMNKIVEHCKRIWTSRKKKKTCKILIFAMKIETVDEIADRLSDEFDIKIDGMHSKLSQDERLLMIEHFKACNKCILVASDLGSRGLDIDNIHYVINYDMPPQIEDYIHRIGRTARVHKKGNSLSFLTEENQLITRKLLKLLNRVKQEAPDWLRDMADMVQKGAYREERGKHQRFRSVENFGDTPNENNNQNNDFDILY
ncbi:ATP-dependent RNA helicase DBP2 [Tritrichomonas foetus]|uniref:RNA helicase n=1 Tax=Tritrichomonas foetus TaxID=1144522 RepID=A0A1J4JJ13_9EUKA|nr:ATP-dependent RNA helicase DBP2 [Tritrichomonas foetus]|eukprot:OHS98343.1 ATP-dependent RNA helicase DBP2 [Tritrichomonas foetus]